MTRDMTEEMPPANAMEGAAIQRRLADLESRLAAAEARCSRFEEIVENFRSLLAPGDQSRAVGWFRNLFRKSASVDDFSKKDDARETAALEDRLKEKEKTILDQGAKIKILEQEKSDLEEDNILLKKRNGQLQEDVDKIKLQKDNLEEAISDLRERADAFDGMEDIVGQLVNLPALRECGKIAAAFSPAMAKVADRYYNFGDIPAFLCQCGQFSLCSEFWDACAEAIRAGADKNFINEAREILPAILDIYNHAFPDNPGTCIVTQPGQAYDFGKEDRMDSSGTHVAAVILPGLLAPSGKVRVKCLVRLS